MLRAERLLEGAAPADQAGEFLQRSRPTQPRDRPDLERRQRGQSPDIVNIAWRAQRRLNARWRTLKHARKKSNDVVAVAVARELAGFCWEIALAD